MNETALLQNYLLVGSILFGLGLVGFISRRNVIVMFLAAEMMLQGVSVSLVAWGRYHDDWDGQILVIFILTVAACEAAIALALVIAFFHRCGTLDVTYLQRAREDNLPPFVDLEVPEPSKDHGTSWPRLTPSGIEPEPNLEEIGHRSHV
jgi:NADH-quinone oxidoreductase subunit K